MQDDHNTTQNKKHISGLDALRTLAIFGVTFFHMFPEYIKGGYLGVSLFFVLTGFLLAYTTTKQESFNILKYYAKRFKRIYPELLVTVLGTLGLFYFVLPKFVRGVFPEVTSIFLGYNNWWQIFQNADYFARITSGSPFTHLWFLGIEIQYYLIWPVLYFLYRAIKNSFGKKVGLGFLAVLALVSAALTPILYNPDVDVTRLYYGTDTRVYALLLGAIIGLWLADEEKQTYTINIRGKMLFAVIFLLTLVAYVFMSGQASFTYRAGMLLMTLLFCMMLGLVVMTNLGARLEHPVCKFFGTYSYGIFLWQYPVIYLFGHKNAGNWPGTSFIQLVLIVLLAIFSKFLCDAVFERAWPFTDKKYLLQKKIGFGLAAAICVILMLVGTQAFVSSYGYIDTDKKELEAQLKANAARLKAENAAAEQAALKQAISDAKDKVDLRGIVCIGDSVMLGSSSALRKQLPGCYIDAAVSRYVGDGVKIAQDLKASGKLGQVVLIHLGTNGPIAGSENYERHTKKLLEVLGPDRDIFWVNFYCPDTTWQDTNNAYLSNIICGYHANVHLVNWYNLVHNRPELLVSDRIHPSSEGIRLYGELVRETMVRTLAEKSVKKNATKK
ncbi:MAG: acyltransferase family protein [Phascolarctobacterium sp.]|nr:acyltransferase family protein [Phascolarctobacterium sp.]